jgi:hypothetical protein
VERNTDGRSFKTIDGERVKVNFLIFYEIDQQTVKTVLRLEDYDSEWVLLASLDATVPIEPGLREVHTVEARARGPGPHGRGHGHVERVTRGSSPLAMGWFLRAPGHFCLP